MTKATIWLVVGNAHNWGKGKTLLGAFINCMANDSHLYQTTTLHIREIIVDLDAPLFAGWDAANVYAATYVDEMGTGFWPAGAEVRAVDIGKGVRLNIATATMLVKWRAFAEEWEELTCTEAMDIGLGGDASGREV